MTCHNRKRRIRTSEAIKLPRRLKKKLKKQCVGSRSRDTIITFYGWVSQQTDYQEWDTYLDVRFDYPARHYRPEASFQRLSQRQAEWNLYLRSENQAVATT
jgi:hypothetical protein